MSATSTSASPDQAQAEVVIVDAWFLLSEGRRFGPLSEDELRGYFRAGMVKADDAIAIPGQVGTLPVAQVAALLQVAAPSPTATPLGPIQPPRLSPVTAVPREASRLGLLLTIGAVVVIGGLLSFGFSGRLTPSRASKEAVVSQSAQPVVVRVESPSPSPSLSLSLSPAPSIAGTSAPTDLILGAQPSFDNTPPVVQPVSMPVAAVNVVPVTNAAPQRAVDTWFVTAGRLHKQSDWSALVAHCQEWTLAEPARDLSWWYLGIAHTQIQNYPAGIEALKHGLTITPNHFRMRWALGDAYMYSLRYRDSAEIFAVLVQEQPHEAGLWNDFGIVMGHLGEYDEAVAALEKAVALRPGYRAAWSNLAWTYARFGYMDRADAATAKANGR